MTCECENYDGERKCDHCIARLATSPYTLHYGSRPPTNFIKCGRCSTRGTAVYHYSVDEVRRCFAEAQQAKRFNSVTSRVLR